jgi:uncharacterized protein (DUF2252 family)
MSHVVERIQEFNQGRDPQLVQLKYQLMQTNAFAFFRGTCHLFYQDWPANSPLNEAPITWICGDLHMQNLGCYKGDNRLVYFNINDFDEAALAPCSWDLARFLTCLLVVAPTLKISEAKALTLCKCFLDTYTRTVARGRVRLLDNDNAVGPAKDLLFHVKQRSCTVFLNGRMMQSGNKRQLIIDGKQTQTISEEKRAQVTALLQKWAVQQRDPQFFTVLDVARRIAGVGSLGVERYILLVEGKGSPDRNYLLDFKAEAASSLQPYLQVRQPHWSNQAERCNAIQQWVQGIPPALFATIEMNGQSYILREMQPIEDKVNLEAITGKMHRLEQLVNMIAKVVAWGQLRSAGHQSASDANTMMDFVHISSSWQKELVHYAKNYAVQVNEDYRTFYAAYEDGKLKKD